MYLAGFSLLFVSLRPQETVHFFGVLEVISQPNPVALALSGDETIVPCLLVLPAASTAALSSFASPFAFVGVLDDGAHLH